jgi:hypothetical protein
LLFLLSSDSSPRYKQDILRCLSAPTGTTVQFRYDRVHLPGDLFKKVTDDATQFPMEGIVCSVASKGNGLLPIVPVRRVQVRKPRIHGETISIALVVGEVVLADSAQFTKDLDELSKHKSPRVKGAGEAPEGSYFFEADVPGGTEVGSSVSLWERTVSGLREQHAYKEEQFFWIALGIENANTPLDTSILHSWPTRIDPRRQYRLLIYHFQPRAGARPDAKMEVTWGSLLQSVAPPDTKIDSRYDLKSWWFSTSDNTQRPQATWLRIRTAEVWDMDLTITIGAAFWRPVVSGALVAVPAILALVPQNLDVATKLLLGAGGVAVGIFSSFLASGRSDKK